MDMNARVLLGCAYPREDWSASLPFPCFSTVQHGKRGDILELVCGSEWDVDIMECFWHDASVVVATEHVYAEGLRNSIVLRMRSRFVAGVCKR